MMVLLVALLWGPLMAHCEWSRLPGLEFFRCEASVDDCHESTDGGPLSDGRCCDGGCCAVESNAYLPANPHTDLVLLPAAIDCLDIGITRAPEAPESRDVDPPKAAPPELSRSWHFLSRAALPVRAPSRAS